MRDDKKEPKPYTLADLDTLWDYDTAGGMSWDVDLDRMAATLVALDKATAELQALSGKNPHPGGTIEALMYAMGNIKPKP